MAVVTPCGCPDPEYVQVSQEVTSLLMSGIEFLYAEVFCLRCDARWRTATAAVEIVPGSGMLGITALFCTAPTDEEATA